MLTKGNRGHHSRSSCPLPRDAPVWLYPSFLSSTQASVGTVLRRLGGIQAGGQVRRQN